jgi:hypothetical protein
VGGCGWVWVGGCVGIVGRVGRVAACDALCRGFDPCRQRPQGVAVDFGPKLSYWLRNQLGELQYIYIYIYIYIYNRDSSSNYNLYLGPQNYPFSCVTTIFGSQPRNDRHV